MSLPGLDLDAEPVQDLALERVGVGLARLDATAGELPEQRQHRGRAALRDEVAAVALDDGRDDADGAPSGHAGLGACRPSRSDVDAEELLTHQQDVARRRPRARRAGG